MALAFFDRLQAIRGEGVGDLCEAVSLPFHFWKQPACGCEPGLWLEVEQPWPCEAEVDVSIPINNGVDHPSELWARDHTEWPTKGQV